MVHAGVVYQDVAALVLMPHPLGELLHAREVLEVHGRVLDRDGRGACWLQIKGMAPARDGVEDERLLQGAFDEGLAYCEADAAILVSRVNVFEEPMVAWVERRTAPVTTAILAGFILPRKSCGRVSEKH